MRWTGSSLKPDWLCWEEPRIEDGWEFGGAERDRTAGLLVANEALSQLSYSPTDSD
jgi:hypothetical protein